MISEKNYHMRQKYNLQAIPVCAAALVLWAIVGGWYVAIAPPDMAGPDNIGIVISTFGLCLFVADRLAFLWFAVHCRVFIFTPWMWGLVFIIWGLLAWLRSFSGQYASVFIIHWSMFLIIITVTSLWAGRRRDKIE